MARNTSEAFGLESFFLRPLFKRSLLPSVSRSSAKSVVEDLQANPMRYKKLVEGAQRVQRELVSPEGLDRYMRIVVNELRKAEHC